MVDTGLLLQHSGIFPVHGVVVVPCMCSVLLATGLDSHRNSVKEL